LFGEGITLGSELFGEGYHIRQCIFWRGVSHLAVYCLERGITLGSVLFGEGYRIRECIVFRGASHYGVYCFERVSH